MSYERTLTRVETYFDKTATRTWERLTSDAPVSKIRETVRRGRDAMRAQMLSRLPDDLRGARVLDAGCGAGQMTTELAARGADVISGGYLARLWSKSPDSACRLIWQVVSPSPLVTCWTMRWGSSTTSWRWTA